MRRSLVLAALTALVLLPAARGDQASEELQPPRFRFGVAAGEVTSRSAILWTRAPTSARVELEVARSRTFRQLVARKAARARAEDDLTLQIRVTGLVPDARYWYRFRARVLRPGGILSPVGTFATAPGDTADARIRFAVSGDADATLTSAGKPAYNRFQVYGRMADERNDFNVNLGDTIYSDSEVRRARPARTVPEKWEKYRLGIALPALQRLRATAGLYSHWDDHEFVDDFSRAENGEALYEAGVKAFRDYSPVSYSSELGLYRSVRWGRNLELFFLDERSFRSAKADDVCGGDLAPTAPQSVRSAFATLAPALANPVPAACAAALDDPTRTMLGAAQYAAFTAAVRASTATWKVILNEVPIQQYYALPYDRWEGFEAERVRLLRFLQASVKNVVFLTTDTHATLINEIRYRTLGGTVEGSGIWEVVTGPVATNTFAKEIDGFLGAAGAGAFIGSLFFKPPPPAGVGMSCAALDAYSYAEVTVTAATLTIQPRDVRGQPVREQTGVPCAPLVLPAR